MTCINLKTLDYVHESAPLKLAVQQQIRGGNRLHAPTAIQAIYYLNGNKGSGEYFGEYWLTNGAPSPNLQLVKDLYTFFNNAIYRGYSVVIQGVTAEF